MRELVLPHSKKELSTSQDARVRRRCAVQQIGASSVRPYVRRRHGVPHPINAVAIRGSRWLQFAANDLLARAHRRPAASGYGAPLTKLESYHEQGPSIR